MLDNGLITALSSAIKKHEDLSDHVQGIYTFIPGDMPLPYIKAILDVHPKGVHQSLISYGTLMLEVVTRFRGQLEGEVLLNKLMGILDRPLKHKTDQGRSVTYIFWYQDKKIDVERDAITQRTKLNFIVKEILDPTGGNHVE